MNLNQSPFVTTGASEELDCVVSGIIPEDLSGTLLRTAPAGLTLGDWRAEHWFDGLCLLYRFTLGPQPRFKAAWLNSDYLREVQDNRVTAGSFGTRRNPGFWRWLLHPIGTITDNANVNVARYGDDICALTESEQTHRLDMRSLQSRGRLTYSGNVPATAIPTAHPRYHVTRGQIISVATVLSGQSKIYIVEQHGDGRRTVLNEYAVTQWPYIHDFGLSEKHAVIMAHPCTLKPWTMLWSTGGLCKKLHYDKSKGSRLIAER